MDEFRIDQLIGEARSRTRSSRIIAYGSLVALGVLAIVLTCLIFIRAWLLDDHGADGVLRTYYFELGKRNALTLFMALALAAAAMSLMELGQRAVNFMVYKVILDPRESLTILEMQMQDIPGEIRAIYYLAGITFIIFLFFLFTGPSTDSIRYTLSILMYGGIFVVWGFRFKRARFSANRHLDGVPIQFSNANTMDSAASITVLFGILFLLFDIGVPTAAKVLEKNINQGQINVAISARSVAQTDGREQILDMLWMMDFDVERFVTELATGPIDEAEQWDGVAIVWVESELRIRTGPNTNADIVGTLTPSRQVLYSRDSLIENNELSWIRIRTRTGKEGWVASEFLWKDRRQILAGSEEYVPVEPQVILAALSESFLQWSLLWVAAFVIFPIAAQFSAAAWTPLFLISLASVLVSEAAIHFLDLSELGAAPRILVLASIASLVALILSRLSYQE